MFITCKKVNAKNVKIISVKVRFLLINVNQKSTNSIYITIQITIKQFVSSLKTLEFLFVKYCTQSGLLKMRCIKLKMFVKQELGLIF